MDVVAAEKESLSSLGWVLEGKGREGEGGDVGTNWYIKYTDIRHERT